MPKGTENPAVLYGIYRRPTSWVVRIVRRRQRHERSFADANYGGRDASLKWAQNWRDKTLKKFPPRRRTELASTPKSLNTTGHPGVTCEFDQRGRIKHWRAKTYISKNLILQATFSVARWGAGAEAMAREERGRQLLQMKGRRKVHTQEQSLRRQPIQAKEALPPPAPRSIEAVRRSNTSGFSGVVRRRSSDGRAHWTAQVHRNGEWVSRSYSITTLGEEVALILALMDRIDWL